MNDLFINAPNIGELYYEHIYLFYDEPLIFSCITKAQNYFFALTIPPQSDADSSWLITPISHGKLLMLEKNLIEIRDAITNPEALLLRADLIADSIVVSEVDPKKLTEDLLPNSGEFLDYSASSELPVPEKTPLDQAQNEMRDIIEISLERDDRHISEIPCNQLGDVLNNIQQLFYAIAYKEGGLSGPIPLKIKSRCSLSVSGMFAASVGIRLKSNDLSDMFGETPLTPTLSDFNSLFSIMGNQSALKEFLANQNPRVAVKYRSLLRTLINYNTGIRLNSASPNRTSFSRHYSTSDLAAKLKQIESEIEEIVENKVFYGTLVGINVERGTFEFISTGKETIKGHLAKSIQGKTFSVPQTVEANVEIRVGTDSVTQEEKLIYTLMAIHSIVAEES